MSLYTELLEQCVECKSTCVQPDLIFQEHYLCTGKFFSVSETSVPNLQMQSWFTHKRLALEETELYTGQGGMSEGAFLIYGRRMGTACIGQCFPGCVH